MASKRLRCPNCGTPLLQAYMAVRELGAVVHRRRDCPRCAARYETSETIVATTRQPVAARNVPAVERPVVPFPAGIHMPGPAAGAVTSAESRRRAHYTRCP